MFEKFHRAAREGSPEGVGLGLDDLSRDRRRRTAAASGSQNRAGGGASFRFALPIEGEPPGYPSRSRVSAMPSGAASVTEPTPLVLVIEDEPQMRRFLRASLTSNGYQVVESRHGRGRPRAGGRAATPTLILLDLGLPDQDGLVVTQRLREWAKTPIIVISARGREEDKIQALDAGADDYLTKPFGVGELLARIRVALRNARARRARQLRSSRWASCKVDLARRQVLVERAGSSPHADRVQAARDAGQARRPRDHPPAAAQGGVGPGLEPSRPSTCASTWGSCATSSSRTPAGRGF